MIGKQMPIYEYECEGCHHTFEIMGRFSDPQPKSCPRCRGRVHKVFHPVGVIFKGSGWHATDYDRYGPKRLGDNGSGNGGSAAREKTAAAED